MFNANKLFFDENNLSSEQFKGCRCALKSEVKLKYFPFSFFTTLMLSTCQRGGGLRDILRTVWSSWHFWLTLHSCKVCNFVFRILENIVSTVFTVPFNHLRVNKNLPNDFSCIRDKNVAGLNEFLRLQRPNLLSSTSGLVLCRGHRVGVGFNVFAFIL